MDAVSSIGTSFMDNAGKVLDGSLSITKGNKTTEDTKVTTENVIRDIFKLNDSFHLVSNDEFNNAISNQLSSENLGKCAQDAKANNDLNLSNIKVGGNATISDIKQSNFVTSALDCAFNQEVCNQLATIFVTNYSNLIDSMISNVTTNNSGDILAAGTAGAVLVSAAGEAASTAAQGIGSGVSTGAQGLGSGIGSAMSGLIMNPFAIACCCFILIIIIGAVIFFMQQKQSNQSGDGGNDGMPTNTSENNSGNDGGNDDGTEGGNEG
jgi:hypothetical protein